MRRAMAPRKKAAKRKAPARKKTAKRTAKKATKKAARKGTRKTARKATKKTAKRAAKKAPAAAATANRPKTVKFETRRPGVFTQLDLQDQIAAWNPELSKKQAKTVVEDMLNTVQTAIKKTGKVRLKGIGTITTKRIPARKGGKLVKNPFTGEMVKQKPKPASVKVKISPAKEIKEK